jgi:hypothetical protein
MEWLIAHLVGDFLLQNDWMANGKRESSWICTVHVGLYMAPFLLLNLYWWQLVLIASQHWIQDRTKIVLWYLKLFGKNEFTTTPMAPWSMIVTDNIFHLVWIYGVVQITRFI